MVQRGEEREESHLDDLAFGGWDPIDDDAYEAGVFTEFMEQRSPGHTVLDDKIYSRGMLDFRAQIADRLAALDFLEQVGDHALNIAQALRQIR